MVDVTERSHMSGDGTETDDGSSVIANRRRFLSVLGVGSVAATAGCTGSGGDDEENGDDGDETDDQDDGNGDAGDTDSSIDPRFGYTSTADDESEPVEPDHTVDLLFSQEPVIEGKRQFPEFYFEPTGLYVESGDTVKFNLATPHHNVNAYHPAFGYTQRVPEDAPAYSSPILAGGDAWYYTFEEEGVHDVVCAPHEVFGMAGRIVVDEASGPGANPIGEAPGGENARPPELTAGLVLSDQALKPETIVEEGTVSWDDLADESKRELIETAGDGGH